MVLNFSPQPARAPTRHRPEWLSSVQQLGIASYLGVQLELHTETAVEDVEDVCSVILRPQRACLRTPWRSCNCQAFALELAVTRSCLEERPESLSLSSSLLLSI